MESKEPCIVVTQLKTGAKSIHPTFRESFWLKKNNSPNREIHVKINRFDSHAEAEKFVDERTPDHTPVDNTNLKKVEAKIKEQANLEAQAKIDEAAKEADAKLKAQEEKMKMLEEKLAKLEAAKEAEKTTTKEGKK